MAGSVRCRTEPYRQPPQRRPLRQTAGRDTAARTSYTLAEEHRNLLEDGRAGSLFLRSNAALSDTRLRCNCLQW